MSSEKAAVPPQTSKSPECHELPTHYRCGPIQFRGSHDGLYERRLLFDNVIAPEDAGNRERYEAIARSARDVLSQRWQHTEQTYGRENPKRIYYLSMEFLIGRSLSNNIVNLGLGPLAKRLFDQEHIEELAILVEEPDAGLGNGPGPARGLLPGLDGNDAIAGNGLRAALRVRDIQADDS